MRSHSYENDFLFSCIWNSFSVTKLMFCTQPRFESDSFWNSEMAFSQLQLRRRGLINRENETIITIEAFWILVLWQLHVNSYGNTQIWYPASFIVDNLFVGIGYFFIYLPWTVAFFVFAWVFFFSFLQLDLLHIYFWGGNALLRLEP